MEMKKMAAEKAVESITDHMVVGLGTGSTAYWAIRKIGERVKEGLQMKAVCTSVETEKLAKEIGIPVVSFANLSAIDIAIDGADEVDKERNLIKGGGGALLREKIIAFHARQYLVIVDESKLVERLGKFPLPVEILPFAMELTLQTLQAFGSVSIRKKEGAFFTTDNGNLVADVRLHPFDNPDALNEQLHQVPGVLETGLFSNRLVSSVIVGTKKGEIRIL